MKRPQPLKKYFMKIYKDTMKKIDTAVESGKEKKNENN